MVIFDIWNANSIPIEDRVKTICMFLSYFLRSMLLPKMPKTVWQLPENA